MISTIDTHATSQLERPPSHDRGSVGKSWWIGAHPAPHCGPRELASAGVVNLADCSLQGRPNRQGE
jgi:hypothetical protein